MQKRTQLHEQYHQICGAIMVVESQIREAVKLEKEKAAKELAEKEAAQLPVTDELKPDQEKELCDGEANQQSA